MKYILVLGLFLPLVLVYGRKFGDAPYFVLFFSMSIIAGGYLIKFFQGHSIGFRLNFSIKDFSPVDRRLSSILVWLWLLIIVSWLIGVSIGLVNGVDPSRVFRNFFGLVVYIVFPVMLIVSPSLRSLIIMIFLAGIVQMCYGLEKSYWLIINPAAFSNIRYSFSELRSFYCSGFIVIFPLFMVGVARQLLPKHYFPNNYGKIVNKLSKSLIFTLLTLIALVIPAMSKAYVLATTILFLGVVFFSLSYLIKTGRTHKNIVLLVFLVVLLLSLLPSSFYEVIIYSYSSQEASNAIRAEQFGRLVSEITFFGNGLGSSLSSRYAQTGFFSYGHELTYVNIVLKLGVFSIFLFSSYVITLMVAWIRIVRRVYVFESLFVIGLMGFLIVGAGNPNLLSNTAVILHCVAMYILIKPFLKPLKENQVESYS